MFFTVSGASYWLGIWDCFWNIAVCGLMFYLGQRYERKKIEKDSPPAETKWAEPTLGEPPKTPD